MENAGLMFYGARLAAFVLIMLLTIGAALMQVRRRTYSRGREVGFAVVTALAPFAIMALSGVWPDLVWAVGLLLLGVAMGLGVGRMSRVQAQDGRLVLRRGAIGPFLGALAWALVAMTLLFGSAYLFQIALLVLAFCAGLTVGSTIVEVGTGRRAAGAPAVVTPADTVERVVEAPAS